MEALGRTTWVIAEGWIPPYSHGPEPAMLSHETASLLNTGDRDAHVEITVFYKDREPVGPYRVTVPAHPAPAVQRLHRPRADPVATDYASVIQSDVPIVVQHTRLDSRQSENALLSTIAFPG